MSDVVEDHLPSKSDFDKLLFSKRHVLLEAVVRTLVTQQRQNRSIEYARVISDYFKAHGRFMELLLWAIDIDFLSTDTYNFKNYLLDIFEPIIDDLSQNGTYSEDFKTAMNFQSKEITTSEDITNYQNSLDRISNIFSDINNDFIRNAKYLPEYLKKYLMSYSLHIQFVKMLMIHF
ncbi:Ras-GAP domain-containing protein [Entamoeba marina]